MASWECLNCGKKNEREDTECLKCGMDKERAVSIVVTRRRTMCEECGHMHKEGVFCHVYTEAMEEEAADDINASESDADSAGRNDEDSDDDDVGLGIKARMKAAKREKAQPLPTPPYVKRIGYVRCNCDVGVPSDGRFYKPVESPLYVGEIQIQLYMEVMDSSQRKFFFSNLQNRLSQPHEVRRAQNRDLFISNNIPLILSYLPLGLCCYVPQVCRLWNEGTSMYQPYIDMRNCVPWNTFKPHIGQVDSILVRGNKLYTGGDKKVLCSDLNSGQLLSMITRDSGDISCLAEKDNELLCSSTNGSTRTYRLTLTGKNIQMGATMWDHTRTIRQLMFGLPSQGPCVMHGIDRHVCTMYTASEDRTIKLWNLTKFIALRVVSSKSLRSATFMCLAQSRRHLFVGTSMSSIAIFNKNAVCEREDIHGCNMPETDKLYCLQLTLELPAVRMPSGSGTSVTSLLCTGPNYTFGQLWAGDSSGQLTTWYVPEVGLDFMPAMTLKAHWSSVNALASTWKHCITISDDGFVLLYDLERLIRIRSINIMEWAVHRNLFAREDIPRRLKSLTIEENFETGGVMVIGTSYGDVVVVSLGTTI